LILAGVVAVPIGALVAIPAIRLSGVYLAIATFGFGILMERVVFQTFLMFGASDSVATRRPSLPGLHLGTQTGFYYVTLAVTLACCGVVAMVGRCRLGRFLRALADSPDALTAHGVSTNVTKLLVFCVAAMIAAIGGALSGSVTGMAGGLSFDFSISLVLVAVLAFSGRRPVFSAFVAAVLFVVVPSYFTSPLAATYAQLVFGGTALVVAVLPSLRLGVLIGGSRRASGRVGPGPAAARMRVLTGAAQ